MGIVILEAGGWLFNSSTLDSDASSKLDSILLHPVSTISPDCQDKAQNRVACYSEWLSHGLAEEQEGTYNPFLCFCIKPAQPFLLKIFIGLGGEGNEDGRETHHTHTYTHTQK